MIRRPVSTPPVNETRSTPRVLGQRRARPSGPAPSTRLADAGRQPGLLEQPHQQDGGRRGQLARLEHEGVAGRRRGRDLPRRLQQRVVPRRDQAADADRLVHDPADRVGVAGVDDPAGVGAGRCRRSSGSRRRRRRCRTRPRPAACRCPATRRGRRPSCRARSGRRAGPAAGPARARGCRARGPRRRPAAPRRSPPRCRPAVPSATVATSVTVGRAADLAVAAVRGCAPCAVDVQLVT